MWSIRRNHQHIKPETLTEYMDGRLGTGALARADRQLASCEACRDELESLRSTVVMVQQLPMEAPRRSFTMVAPPPELVWARPSPPMRLPQWAFAGAASVAAIVLAVLVSADATGLLAPGGQLGSPEAAAPVLSQRAPESADVRDQSLAADGGTPSQAAPTAAPAATTAPAPMEAQAAPAEPSLAPLAPAADVPVASEAEAEAAFAEPYPAPLAGAADAPVDAEAESELAAAPPPEAAAKAPESGSRIATEPAAAASLPETGPGTFQEETSVPAAGPESRELPDSGEEGTAAFWRVLEGLVAFAGALFLVGLVRKMRLSHGVDRR